MLLSEENKSDSLKQSFNHDNDHEHGSIEMDE